jgi:hypothetical protein
MSNETDFPVKNSNDFPVENENPVTWDKVVIVSFVIVLVIGSLFTLGLLILTRPLVMLIIAGVLIGIPGTAYLLLKKGLVNVDDF